MSAVRTRSACVAVGLALGIPTVAGAVDISQLPISAKSQATPNIVFGVDDSGSMDWEIMMPTPSGTLCWKNKRFYNSSGVYESNSSCSSNAEYGYLFPNGQSSTATTDKRRYVDSNFAAIPPTRQFAFVRSHRYNPIYYNPAITYKPWAPAWIDGSLRSFADATPTAVLWHPLYPTSGTATTPLDLTQTLTSSSSSWTFRVHSGMVLNANQDPGIKVGSTKISGSVSDQSGNATIPYYPATYWVEDTSSGKNCRTANGTSRSETSYWCSTGPDGKKLRRIEIKSESLELVTGRFPSGRTYTQELQNFANWFQYYRKRRLLLSSAMSSALVDIRGIRGSTVYFNDRNPVTMRDFSAETDSENGKDVLGNIYANKANGGTPTSATLKYIGEQFKRTDADAPIQFACQRNAAFVLTDGFANDINGESVPSYTSSTWHGSKPYTTTHSKSLADIAASYYTNNLRPTLTKGLLSIDPSDTSPNADKNTDLHMQTFAITLGAVGTIYGLDTAQARNPFVNPPTWPKPANDAASSIDDLWHATINGRGAMYAANNAEEVTAAMQDMVRKILVAAGSDAGIAVSTVNLRAGDNTAFVSSYNARNWTGDIAAFPIDLATGNVDTTAGKELWSARALLDKRDPSSRIIASHDGGKGVPFTTAGLGATLVGKLALNGGDGADVLEWLRGVRTNEGAAAPAYRTRDHLLGDIVTAEPLYFDGIAYQAANDGMLHAFDADNGNELWAYVPYNALDRLKHLADPLYEHRFIVDGTPAAAKIEGETRTILVGGLRGGGAGFYALDITDPRPGSESSLAGKVLWEFPNASTPAGTLNKLGSSFGKPVIVKTSGNGWVVLLTSGYNNASGKGHLFVLDAVSGSLLKTLDTPSGEGLAHVSAWVDDPAAAEPTVEFAYGGDLGGNLWRFDMRGDVGSWTVSRLVSFGSSQPITSAPELTFVDKNRMILVGTGQLLGDADLTTSATQSVYGVIDRGTEITEPSKKLFKQTLTEKSGGIRHVTNTDVDFSSYDGWRFDLPSGERVSTDPSVAFGALVFTSNKPSAMACSTESFLYAVNVANGGQMPPSIHHSEPWTGRRLGFAYSSRPVTVTLPSGKVVAITHKSDTTVASSLLPVGGTPPLRKLGWREVFR